MRFLNRLVKTVISIVLCGLSGMLALNIAAIMMLLMNTVYKPPLQAFVKPCVAKSGDVRQKILCDWVDATVEYYDHQCDGCMLRSGSYPIVIEWSDQSTSGTFGFAIPTKFFCKIELALDENWIYDGGMKFRSTVMHEIGHCYGFEHEQDQKSLMYPNHNPDLTEREIESFVKRLERAAKH